MQAQDFLKAVLGIDGYEALSKAAQRMPELEDVFVPRTILAWLDCAARSGYEGQVPGTGAVVTKNSIYVDAQAYALGDHGVTAERVRAAAALSIAMDFEGSIPESLDAVAVARLSKAVDTLTKARFLKMCKDLEDSASHEASEGSESSECSEASGVSASHEDVDIVEDLDKGLDDMTKAGSWKASDGMAIPKDEKARQEWDAKYKASMARHFAAGDESKLVPVQVPVNDQAFGHFVGDKPSAGGQNQRYRVPMYQKMLAAGAPLPPVFAKELRPGVFQVIDGNARLKAALNHGKTTHLQGYVLKKGIEEPGRAAGPRKPAAPDAPDAPRKAPLTGTGQPAAMKPVGVPKGPGVPKAPVAPMAKTVMAPAVSRTRGFYKSELVKACQRCGQTQMRGRQVVGCLCVVDQLAAAELVQKSEGNVIELRGPDTIITVLENQLDMKPGE